MELCAITLQVESEVFKARTAMNRNCPEYTAMRRGIRNRAWVLCAFVVGCAGGEHIPDAEGELLTAREGIDRLWESYEEALRAEDVNAWAALHTEDARVRFDTGAEIHGRTAIEQFGRDFVARFPVTEVSVVREHLEVYGGAAVELGSYSERYAPPSGEEIQVSGRYMALYERQHDAAWLLHWLVTQRAE